jgi:diadenosine tetraphosphate (Ap4A) HIT family hydrolase
VSEADTAIHRRVTAILEGRDPTLIARMASGFAVLGEQQFLRGYCLLLPEPVAPHLNALPPERRALVLADAARLGDAVLEVTGAVRINYAMFGNVEPALHVHVVPRFADEPAAMRTAHPWSYDWTAAPRFDATRDASLLLAIRRCLERGD